MIKIFAPLEGITTFTYRQAHADVFGGCDAYIAPFITPSDNEKIGRRNLQDILPENAGRHALTVQVLTNQADSFLRFAQKIKALGYDEVNLNLGCPSSTVVGKGRGAGFLREPEALNRFLYEIFSKSPVTISIKTRMGYSSGCEMTELLRVYNQYPISLLTVHPRTREDFYGGKPDMTVFSEVYQNSKNPLCYNGDICSANDFETICRQFPDLSAVMIGRGAVINPALFREINGGGKLTTEEVISFAQLLTTRYQELLQSERFTLDKVKEVLTYLLKQYPAEKKIAKTIKKARTISEFLLAVSSLPPLSNQ